MPDDSWRASCVTDGRVKPWRGYLAWALLVVPLWLTCVWCTHWEPVMGDGWGHTLWYRDHTASPGELWVLARDIYLYENPRIGQVATLVSYAPGPYHVIVTPVVELGVLAMLTALALGRIPSVRRADDAFAGLLTTAIWLACVPQIGPMLFYRPYTGNYVVGFALNLLWLVPYRLELAAPRPRRRWLIVPMLVLGLAAGLGNEHTGVAFLAMGLAATVIAVRRRQLRAWMIAGLLALAVGYIMLLIAPGQHLRYGGLANQASLLGRILDRGFAGNFFVLGRLGIAILPMLPLVALGLADRTALPFGSPRTPTSPTERWAPLGLALAGVLCTVTLLASPKIGPRLFAASVGLVGAGLVGWLVVRLRRPALRTASAILAAGAAIAVALRLILIYAAVGPLGVERLARVEHGAPHTTVIVRRYPVPPSRYFLGEDFASDKRLSVAETYGLTGIELAPGK